MSAVVACGAVLCAGGSVWLLGGRVRAVRGLRRARTLLPAGGPAWESWWRRATTRVRGRVGHEAWLLVGGAVIGLLGESVLPLVAGAVGMPLAGRARRAGEAARARERRADAVIALCGTLAGEVRAGRQPGQALRTAAEVGSEAGPGVGSESGGVVGRGLGGARAGVLAAARFGGDVPGALREAARAPGAEGLLGLAACWRVAVDRGAGLAAGLERLEGALRAERDQRADLRAQLAGARSTALMLAGLPVLGLLMGAALGAEPLRVLLHTGAGLGCLVVGGLFEGVGVWWALRIMRKAEGR
ncbi:type II secretion system F family protein [Streptomyces flavofungini]|uniref:Type II secretion system F family protein n=1 Tax=Streptomyces flavofungini TaxID=68200 RepID=A0ABS0WXQ6_9ACTN|nr:type II secretion system F family protein [Streptomyces flavofungini]MBJ3805591.1 type II secretion system F family protein [Streptomyces flavofungini]GHC72980.1 membrane protein [Streptomyces flavofungini]